MTRRRIVGLQSAGLLVVIAAGIVTALVFTLAVLTRPPNSIANVLPLSAVIGLAAGSGVLLATARAEVRREVRGGVEIEGVLLVSLFTKTFVPRQIIEDVTHHDGLAVVLRSGRRVGSVAFGASLIGAAVSTQVMGIEAQTDAAVRVLTGQSDQAVLPSSGKDRRVTADPLDVVAVGLVERRELADEGVQPMTTISSTARITVAARIACASSARSGPAR